jgi:ubiquinone/menaquinone biosynthesis C-methylase UbiE
LITRVTEWNVDRWRRLQNEAKPVGTIQWIVGNLASMPEIADASFDAVVSLSALEHVPQDELPAVVRELQRVVKPAGRWAITTSATDRAETWFHEPARGLCFTPADLGRLFDATNVSRLDAADALEAYANCDYLRRHLARFYRTSGQNGMPWGRWNPQYVPAGIFDVQRG